MKKVVVVLSIITLFIDMSILSVQDTYFVILAGGNGERLWPISRQDKPKQLVEIGPENKTLIQQAIDRAKYVVSSSDKIWVVTAAKHAAAIVQHVCDSVDRVIVEPEARNTGPAILYCCEKIAEQDPNALAMFLPADPYIPTSDYDKFSKAVKKILSVCDKHDKIGLLGVKPTYPATGYGYIEYKAVNEYDVHPVVRFHEKPQKEVAQDYIKKGNMLWNIGMFGAPVAVFITQFQKYAPNLSRQMLQFMHKKVAYNTIDSIAVDNAVIEKSDVTVVLPVDFEWHDVGNVEIFLSLQARYGAPSNIVGVDSEKNLVDVPDKYVALIGVKDLCIIERDNVLLIVKRDQSEDVREIIKVLKAYKHEKYL